jgi:phage shock protein PspC (stress-responsive transcriptional regulator)
VFRETGSWAAIVSCAPGHRHFNTRFLYFVARVFFPWLGTPTLFRCRRLAVDAKGEPGMPLADELERLNALHERGALNAEEFALAKKRLLEAAPDAMKSASRTCPEPASTLGRLRRSLTDRWFGGVCGGLGELTGIPAWSWRILFVLTAFLQGLGVLMYILLWIFVPVQASVPRPVEVARE